MEPYPVSVPTNLDVIQLPLLEHNEGIPITDEVMERIPGQPIPIIRTTTDSTLPIADEVMEPVPVLPSMSNTRTTPDLTLPIVHEGIQPPVVQPIPNTRTTTNSTNPIAYQVFQNMNIPFRPPLDANRPPNLFKHHPLPDHLPFTLSLGTYVLTKLEACVLYSLYTVRVAKQDE